MRIFLDIGLLVAAILGVLVIVGTCSAEPYNKRTKIYDSRNRIVGDVYCPNGQRRCQIRDNRGRVKYYLERDGRITDTRRRRVYELELPDTSGVSRTDKE